MNDIDLIFEAYQNIYTESRSPSRTCLMAILSKSGVRTAILDFVKGIPEEDLYKEDGNEYGRELEPHTTILYGLKAGEDFGKIKDFIKEHQDSEIVITLGKISIFDNDKYDVLKVDITSKDLRSLNKKVCDNFSYKNDYPDYHPHLTLAYLKKGLGKGYTSKYKEKFKGKEVQCDKIKVSFGDDRSSKRISICCKG